MNIRRLRRGINAFLTMLLLVGIMGCSPENDNRANPKSGNLQALGSSARDLLSDDIFTSMIIEVAFVQGYEPSTAALEELEDFLELYIHKPEGISIVKTAIEVPDNGPYSISKVAELEKKHRKHFNEGERLAVFIFFANGVSTEDVKDAANNKDKVTLGSAYRNTSIVLYEQTLRDIAQENRIAKSEVTSATLQHEFGHLFGLVDNGSPAQEDHVDPDYKAHCNVNGCLMAALVEFGGGMAKYVKTRNKSLHVFDPMCRQDLRANGGK